MKYLIILLFFCSCGVSKKNFKTFDQKVDSTFINIKKESTNQINDSAQIKRTEKITSDSSTVHIEFADNQSDSAAYADVTIKTDSIGGIVINTGGKKIKGITTSKKKIEAINSSDSVSVVSGSTLEKTDSTKTDLTKTVKSTEIKKFSYQIPWYAYLIGFIFLFLIFFFWKQISAARKLANEIKIPYNK